MKTVSARVNAETGVYRLGGTVWRVDPPAECVELRLAEDIGLGYHLAQCWTPGEDTPNGFNGIVRFEPRLGGKGVIVCRLHGTTEAQVLRKGKRIC